MLTAGRGHWCNLYCGVTYSPDIAVIFFSICLTCFIFRFLLGKCYFTLFNNMEILCLSTAAVTRTWPCMKLIIKLISNAVILFYQAAAWAPANPTTHSCVGVSISTWKCRKSNPNSWFSENKFLFDFFQNEIFGIFFLSTSVPTLD